jgi:hypothetical protein
VANQFVFFTFTFSFADRPFSHGNPLLLVPLSCIAPVVSSSCLEFSGPVKSGFLTIFGATGLQPVVKKLKSLQLDFDRFKPVVDRLQPGALILNDSANISD